MENKIALRPSSIRSFMETSSKWYKHHILGEDTFEGNTATYLGTICHAFAETYYTLEEFNPHAILENAPECVDKSFVLATYPEMCKILEEKYLSEHRKPELIEHFMKMDIDQDFIMQGTCDFYNDGVLGDYKTAKRASKDITDYINQMHIYAYLLHLTGREVHTYRIVQIVQKTKTIPPRINILEAKADAMAGKELIDLMYKKTKLAMDNPEYRNAIFHENPYSFLNDTVKVETNFKEL